MAREKVVDLAIRQESTAAVDEAGAQEGGDLQRWATRTPIAGGAMIGGGIVLVSLGIIGAILTTWGFFGTAVLTSLMTTGSGLVFLGLVKRRGRLNAATREQRALSTSEHRLLEERSRRIRTVLEQAGRPQTFEALVARTQWTRDAVLDTLLFMKERGLVAEDLDLDTGEWVYAPSEPELVPAAPLSLMLEERRALSERTETEG